MLRLKSSMIKLNFFDLSLSDLKTFLLQRGYKNYCTQQLYKWTYQKSIFDFKKMTDLSKKARDKLSLLLHFKTPKLMETLKSLDGTEKFLFQTEEGFLYETVLIPSEKRWTLCLSSQVGCNMACKFCYTGKQKLRKRLTTSEIIGQYMVVNERIKPHSKITNLVFMGMGEPLDNQEAVFSSIEIFCESLGIGLSRKKITISTSGLASLIPKITEARVRLAVSLNSANNRLRDQIMPINRKWPIESLLKACKEHTRVSKQKVTFEYVLLKGVTDSLKDAYDLYYLTKNIPCKINIIPFNEHFQSGFLRPSEEKIDKFQRKLINLGAHVFRRKTMGKDIYAACGQLNPRTAIKVDSHDFSDRNFRLR